MRRAKAIPKRYRSRIWASVNDKYIIFHIDINPSRATMTYLKAKEALEKCIKENFKNSKIVETPSLLDPYQIRITRPNLPFDELDKRLKRCVDYWHFTSF